jgi:hypothetical protein
MTDLFLLGAGASIEAGIPDAYGMTEIMLNKFIDDDFYRYRRVDKALQFVVGGLLFQQGIRGENPYAGVNIEDLFNTVNLLRIRAIYQFMASTISGVRERQANRLNWARFTKVNI